MVAAERSHETFPRLFAKTEEFIQTYRRGYFRPSEEKMELRQSLGINQ